MRALHDIRPSHVPLTPYRDAFERYTINRFPVFDLDADNIRVALWDTDVEDYQRRWLMGWDPAADRAARPTIRTETIEVRTRGAGTERAVAIIRDLYEAEASYRMSEGRRGRERLALSVTEDEWRLLRHEMSPHEMERHFGPEGARLNFHGIPIHIERNRYR